MKEGGSYDTANAVRAVLRDLVERKRREKVDRVIVKGYRRQPPIQDEDEWAGRAGREFIAEKPW